MKLKKMIAMLLLVATLGGTLASCSKRQTTVEETTDSQTETNEPSQGDEWMDIWSQDPVFEPLKDDKSLDTKGELENGSWFESFTANKPMFWSNKNNYATKFETADGILYYEAADFTGTSHEAFIVRSVRQSEQFELEFRFKMDYYGNDNGVYISYNGVRVVLYFSESWVRFNRDRGGSQPAGDLVYTNIGYDWHTYRIRVVDRIAKVYIDGVYLTSFKPETFGGDMGEIAFFAYPSNAINAAKAQVDYVSYTVLEEDELKIVAPQPNEICGTGTADVKVSVSASSSLTAGDDSISYYLNGVYAGDGSAAEACMTFSDLKPGVYSVYAVCGDVTSVERRFVVESEADKQPLRYSDANKTESSYILKFNVNGDGSVMAGDGLFPLRLSFSGSDMTYLTADGEKRATMGSGSYIAVVDGGVVWLYRNGKMALSYRLPYQSCAASVDVSGAISQMTVEAHNGTFYQKQLSAGECLNEKLGHLGHSYAVEFAYTAGRKATLQLTNGLHSLSLSISSNGISALIAPQKNAYKEIICDAVEGTALYRITVSAGIAQIYANNVWLASWRMPETVADDRLFVDGDGVGFLQIRQTGDRFYFSGSSSESDWDQYFGATGDPSGIGASCLKVYAKNVAISAEISYSNSTTGACWLLARYFNNRGLFAGYDFDAKCFKMGLSADTLKTVGAGKQLPAGGSATLSLVAEDDCVTLYCNGERIGEIAAEAVNGWGNAGYLITGNASVTRYDFEGDGNALCDTATSLIPNDGTSCFFEMNGYVYSCGRKTFRSEDGGITFEEVSKLPKNGWNVLPLKSGKLLSLVLEGTAARKRYVAYLMTPKGTVIGGPYPIHGDHELNAYRLTMNGRVMQTSSGRIFFASGETENEYIGQVWVYYSDDEGETWIKAKTEFNQKTTGMNLQEGMIVELDQGVLRMYARNDGGFLVYSDSVDGGVTWDTDMKFSNFPSVICAFGVNKDPYTGDIYMSWEYNNRNDSNLVQYPRTRLALAVSRDNAKTWEYIGVFEELNSAGSSSWMHMNAGVWFTKDAILATTEKSIDGVSHNYIVRIPRATLVTMARNPELHVLREDPYAHREGVKLFANGVLAISAETGRVYASGADHRIGAVNGKRTMISAEIISDFLNGSLTLEGGRAVIRVGTAEYVFTAGSKIASVAGAEKAMTFEAVAEDGTVKITLEDLQNLLGLTARCSESGAMVFTVEDEPIRLEYLLSMTGIW